jgi:hypothetical protein
MTSPRFCTRVAVCIAAAASLAACSAAGHGTVPPIGTQPLASGARQTSRYAAANDIPPRLQWMANHGYCGEVAIISAGLYYGQYASQYEARALASDGLPQNEGKSQLLLGGDDRRAARLMHLNALEWDTNAEQSTDDFLGWVKQNVVAGYPVVIGIYMNYYRFYGIHDPHAGAIYDHIVPVTGVASNHPLGDPAYDPSDTLTFSDSGVWSTDHSRPYVFTYGFGAFQRDREQANAKNGPIYSLDDRARNYGVAITGIADDNHETLPVRVATNVDYERPAMKQGETSRPASMPLVLTVTVSNLQSKATYNVYRYDAFTKVPDGAFNAHAAAAAEHLVLKDPQSPTYTFTEHIRSSDVAVYRVVAASSP